MAHKWHFFRAGGVDQVSLRDGADILALEELDQKLWVALAMPTREVDLDPATLDTLDLAKDGRIRVQDILAAVQWIKNAFKDPGLLLASADQVALAQIADPKILSAAKRILADIGKADATSISLADIQAVTKSFEDTLLNGDAIIVPASAGDDAEARKAIEDIIATQGSVLDRSGKAGVDRVKTAAFFAEVDQHANWMRRSAEPAIHPLEDTAAAAAAYTAVADKLDDFFTRSRLAAYDSRAVATLAGQEADYQAIAARQLNLSAQEIAKLPLAKIESSGVLHLGAGLNPAWADKIAAFSTSAVRPILGARESLTAEDVAKIKAKVAPHCDWVACKPTTSVAALPVEWMAKLAAPELRARLEDLIAADAALADDYTERSSVEKLVRLQRDFGRLLRNFVNFSDFYSQQDAVFQAGTLYFDARAARLCVWVGDEAKHASLASSSGCFLVYCTLKRGSETRHVACALTNGDGDNVFVGRNGIFYDRGGNDWDATVSKIISNPISVREAFWSPYKKLVRTIEEQVTKRAQAADAAADAKLAATGTTLANIDPTKLGAAAPAPTASTAPPTAAPAPAAPAADLVPMRKIDIGTVAAIGVAIGGIGTMLAGIFGTIFGLGKWLPLGFGALLLAVSGPSMAIAWLKLRKRNLGPILDANNWAVNGSARINVAFGAAMTSMAELPKGAQRSMSDPFADKPSKWKRYTAIGLVLALLLGWYFGRLDAYLPERIASTRVIPWRRKAAPPVTIVPAGVTGATAPTGEPAGFSGAAIITEGAAKTPVPPKVPTPAPAAPTPIAPAPAPAEAPR
jgi:hypothetical protein